MLFVTMRRVGSLPGGWEDFQLSVLRLHNKYNLFVGLSALMRNTSSWF